jgi:VWFA-related protein
MRKPGRLAGLVSCSCCDCSRGVKGDFGGVVGKGYFPDLQKGRSGAPRYTFWRGCESGVSRGSSHMLISNFDEAFLLRKLCGFAAGIFGLLLCHAASAQQSGAPQPAASGDQQGGYTLQVNARMVVLDVVVTDAKGQVVNGLTKDDFSVYEDKVPQSVVSLDRSAAYLPAANVAVNSTAELDKLEPDAPVNIIVLDELNTKFEDQAFSRYSIKKYLGLQGDTLQLPTMLVAVDVQHFMVLRDYTRSKKEILAALDHHFAGLPKDASWQGEQFNAAFSALMEVAQATAGHAGHKNMIWIGRGFPSIDPMNLPADVNDALQSAIQQCTNMLRDSRVTLYTVDPAGLSAEAPATDENGMYVDDPFGGQVDFNVMAAATGGKAFFGRNDVDNLIGTSARDGASFYTLAYRPSGVSDATKPFRSIRVVMKDPSLHAATREGYYTQAAGVPDAEDAKGKLSNRFIFDLSVASRSTMVYDAVPLTLTRDPVDHDKFQVGLPSADVEWETAGPQVLKASLAVLVESFDRKGKMLNHRVAMETVGVKEGPTPLMPAAARFSLDSVISTAPPAARIRIVVRVNRTGKIGADNFFLVDRKTLDDPEVGPVR